MAEFKRFYNDFAPSHYDLYIDVNRETKVITGRTTITGAAKATTIRVHQKALKVSAVQVNETAADFHTDDAQDAIVITVPATGDVTVTIDYTAPLTDTMMGIYPSYYTVNSERKQIIGTQFETNSARQAFPCVDEPEAKATFNLALKYDEQPGETTLANMPEERVEDGVHYFAETKRMSTYLVAFAFGDLQSKLGKTKSGVTVGIFGTKAHAAKELDFALEIATKSIEFFEDFYHTPYPLPHAWQVALPDFSAGAMENWGLLTYREAYLLLDPDNTAMNMKQLVATVIAHEVAHQWFGDLVTMKWWDDLWLNESFANMMEYVAVDAIKPEWRIWELFQTSEAPAALQRDATDGVQSVHVAVDDPAEIDSLFDGAIVYAKGSRLLVMVRALIGDDALRTGLKHYFDAHQYGNATGADLWAALGDAAGIDVGAVMHSWLDQPGYPVLTASVVDGDLTVTQQQFFIGEGKDIGREWQVPLHANTDAAPQIMTTKTLNLGNYADLRAAAGEPIRFNIGNTTHAIVQYDDTLFADIVAHVDDLDAIAQLQLIQDLQLLAESGRISYADVVPLMPQLAKSHAAIVNEALYGLAFKLRKFAQPGTDAEKQLKALYDLMSRDQLKRLGWQPVAGEPLDDELTRPSVISAALYAENPAAITAAHELYEAHADKLDTMPATIRAAVLTSEVKHFGNAALQDHLLAVLKGTSDASLQYALEAAIPATPDLDLLQQIVGLYKDATVIKPQDLRSWVGGVLRNPAGEQLAWDWIRDDWQWLDDTVGGDMEFTTFVALGAHQFRTPERLAEFKAFFEPKLNVPALAREIQLGISVITSRVALIAAQQADVQAAVAKVVEA